MKYLRLFEEFLSESLMDSEIIKEVNRILTLNKKRGAPDWKYAQIPTNWEVFKKKSKVKSCDVMKSMGCYDNALEYSKNTDMLLYVGVFINIAGLEDAIEWMDSDDGSEINKINPWYFIFPHAFNVDKNKRIYDVTIDKDMNGHIYFGVKVDPKKFKSGFGEIMPYLNKLIKRS
jgi:hypothetical protein